MSSYIVKYSGWFEFVSDVEADSEEEAAKFAREEFKYQDANEYDFELVDIELWGDEDE